MTRTMRYLTDGKRHLICVPYSVENLHRMAEDLGIKRCWFHGRPRSHPHYDLPKRQVERVTERCEVVSPREIVRIIRESLEQ